MDPSASREAQLAGQLANLHGLFVLGMLMTESNSAQEILRLTVTSVATLGPCQAEALYIVRDGALAPGPSGRAALPDLAASLGLLGGVEGELTVPGHAWARAFPLHGLSRHRGYLVVAAEAPASADEQFLWRVLAHQAGTSLANAELHCQERAQGAALAAANSQLAASVAALEHTVVIHETLARASADGSGEAGIASAVHELTGRAVAVEDRFGNLRAWAGPAGAEPHVKPAARRRAELVRRAQRESRPVRDGDRLLALAQPREEVLGVLCLADPGDDAGPLDLVALGHGAVVLAMELAHQRSLAETELRLRRDLVQDLVTGTDDASAYSRAAALGHDLHRPHHVIAVARPGGAAADALGPALEHAAAALELGSLIGWRAGAAILLAPAPLRADALLARLVEHLGHADVTIGVGGAAHAPADLPRSCREAFVALEIRQGSLAAAGVASYDELGVFRLLAATGRGPELTEFVRQWLGALLDYDARHGADLVRTLAEYLERGGNYDETARAVQVHRSTLRYRLQRIREISGFDLGEVDSRLNLHVATRAWRILQGTRP